MRQLLFALSLLALSAPSAPALGQTLGTARLVYQAVGSASGCASEQSIRDGIAARLGYDPFADQSARTIYLTIRPGKEGTQGFVAQIKLQREGAERPQLRTLDTPGPGCGALMQAVLFTISVAIDPSSSMRAQPDREQLLVMAAVLRVHDARSAAQIAAVSATDKLARRPRPRPPKDNEGRPPAEPLALIGALGGGAGLGLAPNLSPYFQMMVELGQPGWSVSLGGVLTTPAQATLEAGSLETSLFVSQLTPCWRRAWFRACAVGTLGALRSTGIGLNDSASNTHLYAALGAGAGVDLALLPILELRLFAQLQGVLARTRVLVDGAQVWRTPDLAGMLGLALAFELF